MDFLKKYIDLSKDVRAKRARYHDADRKITAEHKIFDLKSNHPAPILSCKNVYSRVVGDGINEDTPFCKSCDLLNMHEFCDNRKCDFFADNMEYVIAYESYLRARDTRREFVKNTLRSLVK